MSRTSQRSGRLRRLAIPAAGLLAIPAAYAVGQGVKLVILAVGQTADLEFLGAVVLERERGGIKADPVTLRTSHPRIWAGGDVAHGPRNLIDAIADGQRAAASIHGPTCAPESGNDRWSMAAIVMAFCVCSGNAATSPARSPAAATK